VQPPLNEQFQDGHDQGQTKTDRKIGGNSLGMMQRGIKLVGTEFRNRIARFS
jgi:hypothetical protein